MEDFMKNMQKYEQLAITELDAYLFGQGTHYEIYNKMGAHVGVKDGKEGVYFAVIASCSYFCIFFIKSSIILLLSYTTLMGPLRYPTN
jgi:hypothetical protein